MDGLTPRLRRRVERDFGADAGEVADRMASAAHAERVQAAIVLSARGRHDHLRHALELAALDWRDLLVNAGLEHQDWPARLDAELGPG